MCDHDLNIGNCKTEFEDYDTVSQIPTYYDPTIFEKFYLVKDDKRFAGGAVLFCKECRKPVYMKEQYFECKHHFIVIVIRCIAGCGANWRFHLPIAPSKDIEYLS